MRGSPGRPGPTRGRVGVQPEGCGQLQWPRSAPPRARGSRARRPHPAPQVGGVQGQDGAARASRAPPAPKLWDPPTLSRTLPPGWCPSAHPTTLRAWAEDLDSR